MTRHVQITGLDPAMRQRYLDLHAEVWPEVQAMIRSCNIRDYSIHLMGTVLVGVFDYVGEDFAADMRRMSEDPRTQQWWELTSVCQVPPPQAGSDSPWLEMPAVWTLT